MDKDTLKVVLLTQVLIFGNIFVLGLLYVVLIPVLLQACQATNVYTTGIEYVIRIAIATFLFLVIYYRPQRLKSIIKRFSPTYTDGSMSTKQLRDVIIAFVLLFLGFQVFFLNPQIFGFKDPILDYLVEYTQKYDLEKNSLDTCWLASY